MIIIQKLMNEKNQPTKFRLCILTGLLSLLLSLTLPADVHAAFFHGETLDTIANVLAWVVLIIAPAIGIIVFWIVHILPEKIAYKKKHPQAKAIHTLCLLSLVFGGLLWPLAWLWAYTKPVLHKMAYGTDVADEEHGQGKKDEIAVDEEELKRLRTRVAELESKLTHVSDALGGKA